MLQPSVGQRAVTVCHRWRRFCFGLPHMTDRSVYYRLTDAGWSRHIVPHVSRPWPDARKPVAATVCLSDEAIDAGVSELMADYPDSATGDVLDRRLVERIFRAVDTAPRVGIYDNARKLAEIKAEMRRMGLI